MINQIVESEAALRPNKVFFVETASLLAGLDAAGDCAAIMLLLGDMPGVNAAVIDPVLAAWRAVPTWAAVTAYDDGIGHPFVFSADAFPTLRSLHGDKAVWKIVDRAPVEQVARIAVDGPVPLDVDTPSDYVRVCEAFGYAPGGPWADPQEPE
jgi:molybdenum cofactor cytidylyltransferase